MKCKVMLFVYLFNLNEYDHTNDRGPVVVVPYGQHHYLTSTSMNILMTEAPFLLCRMGSTTIAERIILPFSSKSMNHMAYLAHVATVVWCILPIV